MFDPNQLILSANSIQQSLQCTKIWKKIETYSGNSGNFPIQSKIIIFLSYTFCVHYGKKLTELGTREWEIFSEISSKFLPLNKMQTQKIPLIPGASMTSFCEYCLIPISVSIYYICLAEKKRNYTNERTHKSWINKIKYICYIIKLSITWSIRVDRKKIIFIAHSIIILSTSSIFLFQILYSTIYHVSPSKAWMTPFELTLELVVCFSIVACPSQPHQQLTSEKKVRPAKNRQLYDFFESESARKFCQLNLSCFWCQQIFFTKIRRIS